MIKLGATELIPNKKQGTKLVPLSNGRALNLEEEEAENKAESLPRAKYKRIQPLPGTLAYLLRDLEGGNYAIASMVKEALADQTKKYNVSTTAGKLTKVILLWEKFDDFSKRRIDVFDWLCDEIGLSKKKFYAAVMEGLFDHFEAITQRLLMEAKSELINNSRQFAKEERNFRDREFLGKATGAIKDTAPIVNVDARTQTNNYQSSFRDILKNTSNAIKEEKDYVDAEIVNSERKALKPANMEAFVDVNLFKENEEEKELEHINRKVEIK